jgi:hypothetical protein
MNRAKRAIPYFHHSLKVSLTVLALLVITACSVTIPENTSPAPETTVPLPESTVPPTESTATPTETNEPAPSPTVVEPINYEQIKIWNWGNPEFYLTYDPAYWEATEYDFLVSKSLPDCHIAANGFRDGGPEGPPPYTYESDTQIVGGIEYFLDIEIPNATGIPDMFHIYWDKQNETYQYAVALFPGPVGFDECVAGFWEVMQLSAANGFALETSP